MTKCCKLGKGMTGGCPGNQLQYEKHLLRSVGKACLLQDTLQLRTY